jgi:hypothetical protein
VIDAMAGGEMPLVVPEAIVARSVERRRIAMAKRATVDCTGRRCCGCSTVATPVGATPVGATPVGATDATARAPSHTNPLFLT